MTVLTGGDGGGGDFSPLSFVSSGVVSFCGWPWIFLRSAAMPMRCTCVGGEGDG